MADRVENGLFSAYLPITSGDRDPNLTEDHQAHRGQDLLRSVSSISTTTI